MHTNRVLNFYESNTSCKLMEIFSNVKLEMLYKRKRKRKNSKYLISATIKCSLNIQTIWQLNEMFKINCTEYVDPHN